MNICTMSDNEEVICSVRKARLDEIEILEELIARSVMALQGHDYTIEQRQGALGTVFGVDRQLIHDGTYYAVEAGSEIIACGGWSRRKTLFGSDAIAGNNDSELNPEQDAARIRAFFVDSSWARRGIGSRILDVCEADARAYGFKRFELVATLTGEPFYRTKGFEPMERYATPLPNGLHLPVVRMAKPGADISKSNTSQTSLH
jgi:GNAT superfamily N-acetyltransferase